MVVGFALEGVRTLIQPVFLPVLYWTLTLLGSILTFWTSGDRIQDEADTRNPLNLEPYDFIIVGAGSAGSLLANRLSQSHNVLLLEAGGEPNPLQFIPGFCLFVLNYPETDWMHRSVPQKYASLNSVAQESSWSTGLGLGGTGTLNLMIHLRGHRRDFDNWGRILDDPSWNWQGVLPYFKSYETYEIPGDNVNHGYTGELRIAAPPFIGRGREFVKAGGELGYPHVDLNAPFDEGFDIIRSPIRNGVRQAPYKAFLEPIRSRSTLTIMKYSNVNKVLMRDGVAYGVEYDRYGRTYVAHASKEVIVSAGAVGSPKLLMLSGIGPKRHLQEHNIPVTVDLPVGRNLQDHIAVYLGPFFIREGLGTYFDRDYTPSTFVKWFTLGQGPLTSAGCEATGIFSSEFAKARGEGNWPDIQIFAYAFTNFRNGARLLSKAFSLKFDEIDEYMRDDIGRDSIYIAVSGARPFSRGYIELSGSSPYDKPVIDPNYLGDPDDVDLKVLLEAVQKTLYLMENTTIGRQMETRFTDKRLPGCQHLPFRSDQYWICFIRRYSVSIHHPVGSCSMNKVVDTQLRVYGTKNLRVVDASIQPVLVVTNTQASTLMIGEKASDMILNYWRGAGKFSGQPRIPLINKYKYALGGNLGNLFWKNKRGLESNFTSSNDNIRGRYPEYAPPTGPTMPTLPSPPPTPMVSLPQVPISPPRNLPESAPSPSPMSRPIVPESPYQSRPRTPESPPQYDMPQPTPESPSEYNMPRPNTPESPSQYDMTHPRIPESPSQYDMSRPTPESPSHQASPVPVSRLPESPSYSSLPVPQAQVQKRPVPYKHYQNTEDYSDINDYDYDSGEARPPRNSVPKGNYSNAMSDDSEEYFSYNNVKK